MYSGYSMSHLPLYQYSAIGFGKIRLMHLQAGAGNSPIRITFEEVALPDDPAYEAVSYCWGGSTRDCNIASGNTRIEITQNGMDALWHFRLPDKSRTLWMDAVCINQEDMEERASQVLVMDQIFSNAIQTLAWAGNDAPHVNEAFEFLDRFRTVVQQDIIRQSEEHSMELETIAVVKRAPGSPLWTVMYYGLHPRVSSLEIGFDREISASCLEQNFDLNTRLALCKLCSREYFERCWVFQEIVLSKRAVIQVGANTMGWDDFAGMIFLAVTLCGIDYAPELMVTSEAIRLANLGRFQRRIASDETLESVMRACLNTSVLKVTLPIDRVYAVRGLGTKATQHMIPVDYALPVSEVYLHVGWSTINTETTAKAFTLALAFGMLHLSGLHESDALPSWIPDFGELTRSNAGVLGLYPVYGAGGDWKRLMSASLHADNPRVLRLHGVFIDSVHSIADMKPFEVDPRDIQILLDDDGRPISSGIFGRGEFRHLVSQVPPESLFRDDEAQSVLTSKCRRAFAEAIRSLCIMRDLAGVDATDDYFWRTACCNIDVGSTGGVSTDEPFSSAIATKLMDAKPSLEEEKNWTSEHPLFRSFSENDIEASFDIILLLGRWKNARFCTTDRGRFGSTLR